jgi:hypothetical protein
MCRSGKPCGIKSVELGGAEGALGGAAEIPMISTNQVFVTGDIEKIIQVS